MEEAAQPDADSSVEAAFGTLAETAAAAGETAASGGDTTPTVKEIIRRVGDLARELEKAEAERKASLDQGESASAEDEDEGSPHLDQVANA